MERSEDAAATETALIEQARSGDQLAWENLVRAHQEPVFRFAYLLLGDSAEAEDTAQETFLRAYRHVHKFDSARPLRPWLLSIAANLARNRRRSLGRYWAMLRRFYDTSPAAHDHSAEEHSLQHSEAQQLWAAIRRLDQTDQQVLYLRFFLEFSVEETAQVMGVAPGTVKSRLHRAIGRLRTVIERDFPGIREGIET